MDDFKNKKEEEAFIKFLQNMSMKDFKRITSDESIKKSGVLTEMFEPKVISK